ncbi:MAG: hypothetical protein QM723_06640 [Myxococcaceae bacterium]
MRSRATVTKPDEEDDRAKLLQRLEDLELRVKLLEARVRSTLRAGPKETAGLEEETSSRPRPRCPGCTLELPKGKRGDSCVWCGFQFDALGANFR